MESATRLTTNSGRGVGPVRHMPTWPPRSQIPPRKRAAVRPNIVATIAGACLPDTLGHRPVRRRDRHKRLQDGEPKAMTIRETVVACVYKTVDNQALLVSDVELTDATQLTDLGFDSIAMAELFTHLEIALGYDPFVLMDELVYPETVGELVALYESQRQDASAS